MDKSDLPELRVIAARLDVVNQCIDAEGGTAAPLEVQNIMDEAAELYDVDRMQFYRMNLEAAELWLQMIRGQAN